MKKGIHPNYHEITVEMLDGTKFKTRSTYGKEGDTLKLDIDPTTHPAWTGNATFLNENVSKVAKFKERFSGVNFMGTASKPAAAAAPTPKQEAKPAEAKEEAPKAEEKAEAKTEEAKSE